MIIKSPYVTGAETGNDFPFLVTDIKAKCLAWSSGNDILYSFSIFDAFTSIVIFTIGEVRSITLCISVFVVADTAKAKATNTIWKQRQQMKNVNAILNIFQFSL